ncbi:MAG: hypothetical protein ACLFTT_14405 [Candidatus Hydrogenedentota bacterium]
MPYRLRRPVRCTAFERRPLLFYAALGLMLAFFALALVHELIPGLCTAGESGEEDCPFCKLVDTLCLLAVALAVVPATRTAGPRIFAGTQCLRLPNRYPGFHLRAPPVR